MPVKTMKVASFFAGIGGFDLGFERSGMEVLFQCEINKFGQSVLRKHWPNVPLFNDINEVKASDIPKEVDIWCGGFPLCGHPRVAQVQRKHMIMREVRKTYRLKF
jgi:DNA (cytosine-5)-methyltransferase 1